MIDFLGILWQPPWDEGFWSFGLLNSNDRPEITFSAGIGFRSVLAIEEAIKFAIHWNYPPALR